MTKKGWEKRLRTLMVSYEMEGGSDIEELIVFISQELSTFAEEVRKVIGEDDTMYLVNPRYNEARNILRKKQRQALTNLKTKRGIK